MPSVSIKVILKVFINKDYLDFLLKAKVRSSLKGEFVNVNIQCELNKILQAFGNFILFELQISEDYQPPLQKENNAFKYVNTCGIEKMKGRAIHLPKELKEFFNKSDPSSYKNARPKFDYNCLDRHANLLFGHLNALWIDSSQFTWIYPIVERFSKCLNEYFTYLRTQNIKIGKNHQLEIPVRLIDDSINMKKKSQANPIQLVTGIPTKHHQTRALYQELTGDFSSDINMSEKQIMLHIKQLLISRNDKIIVNLRSFNKGRPEHYTEFWKYIEQYLEERAAVDDR
ncbi:hypothetical protein C1645_825250 [Glomus cerebriforme]|uniref:Uncharacterized protein n=1 Tax=Glomus cerebriforme TaxID=658196 RepID=A0A397SYU6_9GLOM|nr:hypothetical protein C1645_825250 [Glomus cerebriforme]